MLVVGVLFRVVLLASITAERTSKGKTARSLRSCRCFTSNISNRKALANPCDEFLDISNQKLIWRALLEIDTLSKHQVDRRLTVPIAGEFALLLLSMKRQLRDLLLPFPAKDVADGLKQRQHDTVHQSVSLNVEIGFRRSDAQVFL